MHGSPPWRRAAKVAVVAGAVATGTLLLTGGAAWAEQSPPPDPTTLEGFTISTNLLWVVIGAVLVIFMQAGFALVETGFCRAKHAAHVVSTNFAIFGLGFVAFFLVGYAFMFGGYRHLAARATTRAIGGQPHRLRQLGVPVEGRLSALGDSGDASRPAAGLLPLHGRVHGHHRHRSRPGAMAERWKWKAFVGWGLFCGAIYYPLFGAWTWGGGWLASSATASALGFGYVDFAGSGVVHTMGGVAALAGAIVLGPRIGKFDKDGKPRTLAGHHIPMAMLGTFILLFGWFGFNAASTFAATDIQFARGRDEHRDRRAPSVPTIGMFWIMTPHRQARPRHDGQRHARRPRGHHGPVRLRAIRGPRRSSACIAGVLS